MKPVLIVEGKEIEVYAVFYRDNKVHNIGIIDEHGVSRTYVDINENTQYYTEKPLRIDFNKCLKWEGRYDPIYETIDKMLEDKSHELQKLALEYIETKQPFTPSDLQQEYFLKQREQMGLMDAQEIVYEFMEDDVELNGGEENATK